MVVRVTAKLNSFETSCVRLGTPALPAAILVSDLRDPSRALHRHSNKRG
jgi:hypothetical protein